MPWTKMIPTKKKQSNRLSRVLKQDTDELGSSNLFLIKTDSAQAVMVWKSQERNELKVVKNKGHQHVWL